MSVSAHSLQCYGDVMAIAIAIAIAVAIAVAIVVAIAIAVIIENRSMPWNEE